MKTSKLQQLFANMRSAHERLRFLSPREKAALEKTWDVEHAYYSSVLEGSQLDREEFDKLAENIA